MTESIIPAWATPGAVVARVSSGGFYGPTYHKIAVDRVTATQIVAADRKFAQRRGSDNFKEVGRDFYRAEYLLSLTDPVVLKIDAREKLNQTVRDFEDVLNAWKREKTHAPAVDAILAAALILQNELLAQKDEE